MSTSALRNRYVTDAVSTVSPARLVVMLYDRLALDLIRAKDAIDARRYEGAHDALVHAQEIVSELHAALDPAKWPPAAQLGDLYVFLHDQLVAANIRKDASVVDTCVEIVEPLRDAWHQAAGLGEAQPLSAA